MRDNSYAPKMATKRNAPIVYIEWIQKLIDVVSLVDEP